MYNFSNRINILDCLLLKAFLTLGDVSFTFITVVETIVYVEFILLFRSANRRKLINLQTQQKRRYQQS